METTIEVTVELGASVDQIAGRVRAEDGSSRWFTGYVGLLAAIDAVLASERVAQDAP